MELSKRMNAVAQMVPAGHITADVGCDHGFVSIYLVERGICPHVYAADVRPGPLERAKEHIVQSGLSERITPVLSDGLRAVPVGKGACRISDGAEEKEGKKECVRREDEAREGADVMIAAGMGGKLTIRILSDVPQKTEKLSWVVLEPQSEVWLVRQWLRENGFLIVDEDMVFEDGKYYPVIKAGNLKKSAEESVGACSGELKEAEKYLEKLEKKLTEAGFSREEQRMIGDCFGPFLLYRKSPVLLSFLEHTIEKDMELLCQMPGADGGQDKTDRIGARRRELAARMELAKRAADLMKGENHDSQRGWKRDLL